MFNGDVGSMHMPAEQQEAKTSYKRELGTTWKRQCYGKQWCPFSSKAGFDLYTDKL